MGGDDTGWGSEALPTALLRTQGTPRFDRINREPGSWCTMAKTILIVEDSVPIRRLVEICLRGLGSRIVTAADGTSALVSALADPPELIVLDIGLPGSDGWEVLAEIRNHPVLRSVRVLVLTAHSDEEGRFRSGGADADAFMSKPFAPAELVRTAARLLEVGPRRATPSPVGAPAITRE